MVCRLDRAAGVGALLHRQQLDRSVIPAVWLREADLLAGRRGITGHAQVSRAFKRSNHTDPGHELPDRALRRLLLKADGFDLGAAGGDFGATTLKAVKKAQATYGLKAGGIAGPLTWHALETGH